jgi:hypothetical protein
LGIVDCLFDDAAFKLSIKASKSSIDVDCGAAGVAAVLEL